MTDSERIFDAIGYVDRQLVAEAESYRPERRRAVWTWAAVAAAFILAVPAALLLIRGAPAAKPEGPKPAENPGGYEAMEPMPSAGVSWYDGPILPLEVTGGYGITAQRQVCLDLSDIGSGGGLYTAGLTDTYTLTNTGDTGVTLTVRYPFVGTFVDPSLPELTVDGERVDAVLRAGPYAGGFVTFDRPMLAEPTTAGEYAGPIEDGSSLAGALAEIPKSDTPVNVYELRGVDFDTTARYAVLSAEFTYDKERTTVFLWGFNDDGFTVEQEWDRHYFGTMYPDSRTRYIIVAGEDIEGLTLQGYRDAKLALGEEMEVTTDLVKYTTTMGQILDTLAEDFAGDTHDLSRLDPSVGTELYVREVRRGFALYSRLGTQPSERYGREQLERLLNDTAIQHRVMYMEFTLTIPAGGTVTVEAKQSKGASGRMRTYRFDIAETLGTQLDFTSQSVTITGADGLHVTESRQPLPTGGDIHTVEVQ